MDSGFIFSLISTAVSLGGLCVGIGVMMSKINHASEENKAQADQLKACASKEEVAAAIKRTYEDHSHNSERHRQLFASVNEQVMKIVRLEVMFKSMVKSLNEIKSGLKEIHEELKGLRKLDKNYQKILSALANMSDPDKQAVLEHVAGELTNISTQAFQNDPDPITGAKWKPFKHPRGKRASEPGSTRHILWDSSLLGGSICRELTDDAVIVGSNRKYAAAHQYGYSKRHIPPCPYLGKPPDFERRLLDDLSVLELLQ
jgi:phage virion morphogenesis protein